jgi:N,N'-diacetyllegionaminate synthase
LSSNTEEPELKEHCKIVFEIGPTHQGEESAMELIKIAKAAGADAVKVQILNAERLVKDSKQMFTYGILNPTGGVVYVEESLRKILERRELTKISWERIAQYAQSQEIEFYATVTEIDDIEWINGIYCQSIKIASGDLTFHPLLEAASQTGKNIQIDTGNATIDEITKAIEIIRKSGNNDIVVHHCPPGYPAVDEKVHLGTIPFLRDELGVKVAFSDHSLGWHMDIAALSLGASILEKTLTLDRSIRSPEHVFSLEPREAALFVNDIRSVEKALLSGARVVSAEESIAAKPIRRSGYYKISLNPGKILTLDDVDFQRPGIYLTPDETISLIGKKLAIGVKKGQQVQIEHFH